MDVGQQPLVRPWRWVMLAVVLWIGLATCGSWWLARRVSAHDQIARLTLMTRIIADDFAGYGPPQKDSFGSYLTWAQRAMPLARRQAMRFSPISYLLLWKPSGSIVLLAARNGKDPVKLNSSLVDHSLDATVWPALAAGQKRRIRSLTSTPWLGSRQPVDEVTVPIAWSSNEQGYLSVGFNRSVLLQEFWPAERRVIIATVAVITIGVVLIVVVILLIARRFEHARLQYTQTMRARTSLLSERGMLASVLAHEVRSPLTALGFNLHFLRGLIESKSAEYDRQVELTRSCDREIRRLDLMLSDFLTRTQVISGSQETAVNSVVREALEFLRPALERQHVRVVMHLDEADPRVNIGPDELRQVTLNLCANAQDAMPRGGTLVISTVAEADSAALLVRDSGKGIPADVQARLFEPFFTTKPGGSGLGLALVRRVVSGAGGKVFCESEPGQGATFRIVLPRAGEAHHLGSQPNEPQRLPSEPDVAE